jgi:hypothetical protein
MKSHASVDYIGNKCISTNPLYQVEPAEKVWFNNDWAQPDLRCFDTGWAQPYQIKETINGMRASPR